MVILSKACKPDNFESHNSLKLSFTNIRGLRSNFVDCESFLESNSPDILALCETNLNDSIDSGNFFVRGYLPLIWKDSTTHMHGLLVYARKLCRFLLMFFTNFTSLSYFFFLYRSPSSSLCMVSDSVLSNIDGVLLINASANVFAFGHFNSYHKNWVTYSSGTDTPGELCYNFSISHNLTQIVNFPPCIPDWDSQSPAPLDFFLSSALVFVLQWLSLHWEILIMLLSQFPLTYDHIHNRMLCFTALHRTILMLIRTVFMTIWEMFHGRISLNSVLLVLLVNSVSGFRLEVM